VQSSNQIIQGGYGYCGFDIPYNHGVFSEHQQTPPPHIRGTKQQMILYNPRQAQPNGFFISPFGQQW